MSALLLALLIGLPGAAAAVSVTQTTFADFSSGTWSGFGSSVTASVGDGAVQLGIGSAEILPSFSTTTALLAGNDSHAAVVSNYWLYVIGGNEGGVPVTAVRRAPINLDGTLGAWTAASSLPGPRAGHAATVWNGRIYVAGGATTGGVIQAAVYHADINADGSLSAWTTSSNPLPAVRNRLGMAAWNGTLYVAGGDNGTDSQATVYYAPINADGTVGSWTTSANPLPAGRAGHGMSISNGRLYVTGGSLTASVFSTVYHAPLNADGAVGTWTTSANPLPSTTFLHAMAAWNGSLYVSGGYLALAGPNVSTVLQAPINTDGTIGTWRRMTVDLPESLDRHSMAAWGGRLYMTGGTSNIGTESRVRVARLNTMGYAGGPWTTNAITLPQNWSNQDVVAWQDGLYALGGAQNGVGVTSVTAASLNADGSVGAWSQISPNLIASNASASMDGSVIINGWLYSFMVDGAFAANRFQFAQLCSTGTLCGGWTTGQWPWGASWRDAFPVVAVSSAIYVWGGEGAGCVLNNAGFYATTASTGTMSSAWRSFSVTGLPGFNSRQGGAAWNGYLYNVSGRITNSCPSPPIPVTSAVYYVPINADGSVTASWTATTALPVALQNIAVNVWDGYLYVMGGEDTNQVAALTTVYRAPFNANGTLGSWEQMQGLPAGRSSNSSQTSSKWVGNIYVAGGTSIAPANTVFYSGVSSYSAVGSYSNTMDLGSDATLKDFSWSAALNGGTLSVFISTASSVSGFSPFAPATSGASLNAPNVRHVRYRVDMTPSALNATPTLSSVTAATLPSGCVDGFNVKSDGSANFTTIQAAVNALPATLLGHSCIVIRDGATYNEQVTVQGFTNNGSSITIQALPGQTPVVRPPGTSTAAFVIANASVNVSGIDISGLGSSVPYGIFISSSYVQISSVNVLDAAGKIQTAGVVASSWTTVSYTTVTVGAATASGIVLPGIMNAEVSYSSVVANNANLNCALWINGGTLNTITRSYFGNALSNAVCLDASSSFNTITQSTIASNTSAGFGALFLTAGASNNTITSVFVSNHEGTAGSFNTGTGPVNNNAISQSTFTSNFASSYALHMIGASNNTFTSCTISNPAGDAAYLSSSGNNFFSSSTFNSNAAGKYALSLFLANNNTISKSSLSNPAGPAAGLSISAFNTLSQSTFTSGGVAVTFDGSGVGGGTNNTIQFSYVQGSTAVFITNSTDTVINSSELVAASGVGNALVLTGGSVNLTVASTTLHGGSSGRGLLLAADNSGGVSIGSVTVTGSARGLEISTQTAGFVLAIDSITFRGLTPGATAIHFLGGTFVSTITLANFEDASIDANVNAAALDLASRINMNAHSGVRSFPAFENDPNSVVDWEVTPIVLAGPSNGISVSTSAPTFTWKGAVPPNFRFMLAQDAGFASIVIDSTTSNFFFVSTVSLANNTTYWWKIGVLGASARSQTYSFVVDIASPVYSGPQVSTTAIGPWTNLPMTTYLSSNSVTARVTLQDTLSGLLVSTGLPAGLVGQWHFDESSGTAALDASNNSANGAFSGGSARAAGYRGGALNLAANGSFVQIPHAVAHNSSDITIELWIKPAMASLVMTGADPFMALVAKRTANASTPYVFGIRSGGTLSLNWWGAGFPSPVSSPAVRLNEWQHVAATRSGPPGNYLVTFYFNGAYISSGVVTDAGAVQTSVQDLLLGKDAYFQTQTNEGTYQGLMDEVRIFNVSRSSAQILADYESDTLAAHNRSAAYGVLFSTNAGQTWSYVSTNSVTLTGANGTASPQTLQASGIPLVTSTGPLAATNQIQFVTQDVAGNVSTATYVVLVDTTTLPPPGCETVVNVRKSGFNAFTTIQAAVNSLPASLSGDSCVVVRDTQTYGEEVTVRNLVNNDYRLNIMADPSFVSSAPVVTAPGGAFAAFNIANASVSIVGIRVEPSVAIAYGIYVSSPYVTISSVSVYGPGWIGVAGIAASSWTTVSFTSVTVTNAKGILLQDSVMTTVSYSSVTNSNATMPALFLNGASSNTIVGVVAVNQGLSGEAVRIENGTYNNVSQSSFTSLSGQSGLHLYVSSFNTVTGSYLSAPGGTGAKLESGHFNTISQSTVASNTTGFPALSILGSSSNTVTGSYISNTGDSVRIEEGSHYNAVSQSTMASNNVGYSALYLLRASSNTITQSYMTTPGGYAAWLDFQANGNTISRSTMSSNNVNILALWFSGASSNTITQSYMTNPAGDGTYLDSSSKYNTISQSTMTSNVAGYSALLFSLSSSNTVTGSYISNPLGYGARLTNGSQYNTISQSTITSAGAGACALAAVLSSSNTIQNSYIQGSTGVFISDSAGTVINSSVLVATDTFGSALVLTGGSVNLTVASSTLRGGPSGRGLQLDAGNDGVISIGSVTVTGAARGLEISTQAAGFVLAVDSITFRGLTAGATAIHFLGGKLVSTITLANFEDTSIGANVSGAALDLASRIFMLDHYGVRTSSAYENDPNSVVGWEAGPYPGCAVTRNVGLGQLYNTITAAVAALPTTLTGHSCVVIRDGATYNEQVTVRNFINNGSSITIFTDPAVGAHAVISPPVASTAAFLIANASVSIQGISVAVNQSIPYGVWASSAYVQLSSVSVSTSGSSGIYTAGVRISSWSAVSYSSVAVGDAHGFWLDQSTRTTVSYSTAVNNSAAASNYSVYIDRGRNNAFTMMFSSNSHATGYGFFIRNSDTNTITQSYLWGGNKGAYLDTSSNYNDISFSTMIGNTDIGLYAIGAASNTVTQSYLWGSSQGVFLNSNSNYNAISFSTMIGNAQSGFYATGADFNTVTQSYVWGGQNGAQLIAGADLNTISLSTMVGNSGYGLSATTSDSNTLTQSYMWGANYGGYFDTGSDYNTINLSTMIGNSWAGLYLGTSDSNTVTQSYIWGGSTGVYLSAGSDYNAISLSTMIGNSEYGLYVIGADSNTVTQSYMQSFFGARLDSSADNNTISFSTMIGTLQYGLYAVAADSNNVTQSYMWGGWFGARLDPGANRNTISFSTVISNNNQFPALYINGGSTNTIEGSYIQGSTAALISGSTGTVIRGTVFVATNTIGSALTLNSGIVNLTITSSTLRGGPAGRGLLLDIGNSGAVSIASVTVSGSARGLEISTQAAGFVLAIDSVTFRGLTPGATAIHFLGGTFVSTITFANFEDTGVGANVSAAALDLASRITMFDHYGVRTSSAYENDPNSLVNWEAGPYPGCAVTKNVGAGQRYAAISAGVAALPTTLTGHSCVVVRDSAVYGEQVQVQGFVNSGSSITIMGDPALAGHPSVRLGFVIFNASVNIANVDVIPNVNLNSGIFVSSPNVTISSVNVIDPSGKFSGAGIVLSSWTTVSYTSVTVAHANAYAFLLPGSTMSTVSYSTAVNNSAGSAAVSLANAKNNAFTVVFASNSHASGTGFYAAGSDTNTVTQSYLWGGNYGVNLAAGSDSNAVGLSTMVGNAQLGFFALGSASNTVAQSYSWGGTYGAIFNTGANYNAVSLSTMIGNSVSGLYINGSASNTVSQSFLSGGVNGAEWNSGAIYNRISLSTMIGVSQTGLRSVSAASNTLTQSYLWGATQGASLESSNNNAISLSTMIGNSFGLWVYIADSNTVTQSYLWGAFDGVRVEAGADRNTISLSTMIGSTQFGFFADASASNTVTSSYLSGSVAFRLTGGSNYNAVSFSTMIASGSDGFYANASDSNTVSQSYMSGPNAGAELTAANSNVISLSTMIGSNVGLYAFVADSNLVTQSYLWGGQRGAWLDGGSDYNAISLSTMISDSPSYPALYLAQSSSNTIQSSYIQGSTAALVVGSTGTVLTANVLVATNTIGNALNLTGGSSGMSLSLNTIKGGPWGNGVLIDGGSGGSLILSTNTILAGAERGIAVLNTPAGASVWITSNTVLGTITPGRDTMGINLSGLASGATVANNGIYYRTPGSGNATGPLIVLNSPGVVVEHNRMSNPGMLLAGDYRGVYLFNADNASVRFNDFHSTGTGLGIFNLMEILGNSNGIILRDNVFSSSATATISSATLRVSADSQAGFVSNYNDFFSSNSFTSLVWGAQGYSTLSAWQAGTGMDANSIARHPRWKDPSSGAEDFHQLSQAGRWNGAGFVNDGYTSATIDAADPGEAFGNEQGLNGGRANLGSYGNTTEASKTPPSPTVPVVAGVFTSSISVSYGLVGADGYIARASTAADFSGTIFTSATANGALSILAPQGLAANVTYYLIAGSVWGDFNAFAAPLAAATLASTPTAASPAFSAVGLSSVTASWIPNGNPLDVTTYTVVLSTGLTYPNAFFGNVSLSTTPAGAIPTATLTGLGANTTYYLYAAAINHGGVPSAYVALGDTVTLANTPVSAVSTFSAVSNNLFVGAWDGNGNGAGTLYEAAVSTEAAFPNLDAGNVYVSTRPEGAPSAPFTGLSADTTYYLFARAVNRAGSPTAYTALGATVTLVNLPTTAVTTFTAVTNVSLTAAWSVNGNGAGTQYSAVVSTSSPYPNGSAGNVVITTSPSGAPSADFAGLYANATYYFFAAAINRSGSPTAYVSLGSTVTVFNVPLTAVSTFTAVDAGSMTVAWGANNNIAGTLYEATLSTGNAFPNADAGNVAASTSPPGAPAAVINSLVGNTTYYLAVRTIARDGTASAYLALGSSVTLAFQPATAATTFTVVNASSMSIKWSANGNAVDVTTYTVVLTTGSTYPNSFAGNVPFSTAPAGALPSAAVTGLGVNTTYYLFVNAINHGGLSTPFTALGATVTLASPPATAVSTFTAVAISSMGVAWSVNGNPVDVTTYTVVLTTGAIYPNTFSGNVLLSTLASSALPTATLSGLLSNSTYQLFIAALNHGGAASAYTPLGSTVTLASPPATAASTFSVVSNNAFAGTWSGNGNAAGTLYEAAVSTEAAFPNADTGNVYVSTRPEGTPSADFAGLGANATYYLFVRAVSHAGQPTAYTSLGDTVTLANVPASDVTTFTAVTASSVAAQWLAAGNPPGTQFQLAASTWSGFTGTLLTSGWTSAVSTAVYGLSANATYYFGARARNWPGAASAYLALGSTVTLANPPTALALDGVGAFSLPLAWGPAGNFSGGPDAWTASSSVLPTALQGHALAASGGRLYVSGGSTGAGALATVRFAAVAADGTVGPWTLTTALPAARDSHAMAAWSGRLYVAGGFDGGSAQATVWWAPILEGGLLGPWRSAPSLPGARHKFTLTAYGGALFAVGGDNGIFAQSTVYAAAIRADGSLGPWSATTVLPAARAGHAAAAALGRLYVSGGVGAGLEATVISAALGGAAVGAWTSEVALPAGRTRHAMAASPSRLYVVGGHDGATAQTTVWSSPLSDTGVAGAWEAQAPLPSARYLHGAALIGERLAVVGGSDGGAAVDLVSIGGLTGTEYLAESANDAAYTVSYASSGWRRATSYEFLGLTPNTTYYARVRGRSPSGAPTAVAVLGSTITLAAVPLSAPSTFTSVDISSIGVQWLAGSNPAGTEFRAAASTAADFSGTTILAGWGTATSALFNALALNTSYYFAASGRNAAAQEGSPLAMGAAYTLAAAPTGSVITTVQTTGFSLEWSANANPIGTRFEAQAAIVSDFSTVLASSVTFSTAAIFSGLPSASTFYARVRALNGNGIASSFDVAVSTLTGIDGTAPGVSTGAFAYQGAAAGALYAAWVAPGDDSYAGDLAVGSTFFVQWSTSNPATVLWSTSAAQVVASTGPVKRGAAVSVLISGLPVSKTAFLRVWTSDDGGNYSAPSDTFSAYASPFTLASVDAFADAGRSPSLAVDRFGNLSAAYRTAGGELRYLKRTAGTWGAYTVVDAGPVAELAVAVDNDGNPQIFYRDAGVARLKIARFTGSWAATVIENGALRAGGLALGPDGNASISYYDVALGDIKYGRWTGAAWSTETVRSAGDVGRVSGLALDAAQNPHIAYSDDTGTSLHFSSKTAASWSDVVVDAAVSAASSPAVAVDADGRAFIAYAGAAGVNVASITAAGLLSVSAVEGPGFDAVGGLALDGAGQPFLVYRDAARLDLKFARWTGTAFSTGTVDAYGDQGEGSALAIDGAGGVTLAYYDKSAGALKAASYPAAVSAPAGGNAGSRAQAPYNMAGAATSVSSIQWTWIDNAANELGYRLYGAAAATGPYVAIAGTATITAQPGVGGTVSYTEGGLTAGTTYYRYAAAVTAGGAAASKVAAAYPFNTADATPPVITNNQAGDLSWRRTNAGLYDVDFLDVGGTKLDRFEVKASTVPGGAGPDLVAFTAAASGINADTYLADWPLPALVFTALRDDVTNYISVRAVDGAGNAATLTDAFLVLKDTTAPTIVNGQAGDPVLRAAAGTLYNVDALDATSGLAAFQYSASLAAGSGNAALIGWTDIALPAGATSYTADWTVAFAGLASNATNYISVRTWDRAGSTTTLVDAFHVIKDTVPPATAIAVPASAFRSALMTISGTSADLSGLQGTELSIQQVAGGLYWNGAAFGSAAQLFIAVGSGTAWSLSPGISWTNNFAYRIVARSSDSAGNYTVAYATADFTFDASSPTVAVTAPAGGTIASLTVISGTAADAAPVDSGISNVEVRLRRNTDGKWWNWFTSVWGPTAVSSITAGTTAWSLSPTPQLKGSLDGGTSYFIAVRASDNALPANSGDFFAAGSTFTWQDVTPPSAVVDLAAVNGVLPGSINLSWTAPGDDAGAGFIQTGEYRIFYSTDIAAVASTSTAQVLLSTAGITPASAQAYTLSGLLPGVTYYVRLALADSDVNWSAFSNQASTTAAPAPFNAITGHVVDISTQGITAVQVECWNAADALMGTTFTLADGSGTYSVNGLPPGNYKLRVTWTVNGFSTSLWQDGIAMGSSSVDFFLEINYALATLTGTLSSLTASSYGGGSALGTAAASGSHIELYQAGRQVAQAAPNPLGTWTIGGLLPGKYSVRAFTSLGYTAFQDVELTEGEVRVLGFVFDPLPKASVFAFPNPARTSTTIRFETALAPFEADILIFDLSGNLVREISDSQILRAAAPTYHADWDLNNTMGQGVAPGVYNVMVKVKGGSDNQTAKVIKKVAVVR